MKKLRCLIFFVCGLAIASAVAAAQTQNHGVTVTWVASACSAAAPGTCSSFGYNVFEGPASGQESTAPFNASLISGLTFTDNGATMNAYLGTTRCYVIQAQEITSGLTLSSANSPEVCFSFPNQPSAPGTAAISPH
jgi:hypothetical protein